MAGYIPPPPNVNVGDGATAGRFLVGTGVDEAGWAAMSVSPAGTLGDPSGVLSALLAALGRAGVDTSGVPDWNRGPAATAELPLGPASGNNPANAGPGFHILYGNTSTGNFNRIVSPQGIAQNWTTGDPMFDPRGSGATRSLIYCTGAGNEPWTDLTYALFTQAGASAGGGTLSVAPRFGNVLTIATSAGTPYIYGRFEIKSGATVVDWDYQP